MKKRTLEFAFKLFSTEFEEEINFEKRRRNQAYFALDYSLSRITYFDFFSADAFKIAKYTKYFAQLFNINVITPEILLLACFYCDSNLSKFLAPYDNEENLLSNLINKIELSKEKKSFMNENFRNISQKFRIEPVIINQNVPYSREVNQIFTQSAEAASIRFKTPIISSEIIFLTLMEDKIYSTSKIIKKMVGSQSEWYLLRFKLIKHLHNQESNIRSEVSKNQQYFAYLLKTQLPEKEFDKLLETKNLKKGILLFRNTLVSEIMQIDLFKNIFNEIKKSIKVTNKRKYSS